jgi:hypothetical protein
MSRASTRLATCAAQSISRSRSLPLIFESAFAVHLAVRIATMSAVAMRSEGPSLGQSGFSV